MLAKSDLKVALIEKATFPRDKICGDALSGDVVNQLYWIDEALAERFNAKKEKHPVNTIRIVAPNENHLDLSFINPKNPRSAAYVSTRMEFDNFLFSEVQKTNRIDIYQGTTVKDAEQSESSITVHTDKGSFKGKIALGAGGAHSVLNRKLSSNKLDRKHHLAGVRQYFEGVTCDHEKKAIELHFIKDLLPGYLWIFPLPNNKWNVGLGIESERVSKEQINIREKLTETLKTHPVLKDRFKNAKPLETIKGFGLPIGSRKVACSGNRFLLLGDAACLIDPFSGEGIANAMRSGRVAAKHTLNAFEKQRFDAEFNKQYDKEIYDRMWKELRISAGEKRLLKYPKIFNLLVNKTTKNKALVKLLTSMIHNIDLRADLQKPSFYLKLLFNR